jgi:hypothetical protein|nr:MAG TPA: hypothetical protein [Caudoviricetes sp.]
MLLDKQTYDDFMNRLAEVDALLGKDEPLYTAMAADRFAEIEGDLATVFSDGRVYTIENVGFVEYLLEVWQKLKSS